MAKVAVVTGASSGIGLVTAKALAGAGWRVIATGRDPARSAAAEAEILAASTGSGVTMLRADLSRMAEAAALADQIAAHTDRIDLLVNNAGGMTSDLVITPEGLEENFAGNHLGPFLLTNRLLPLLARAAQGAPNGSVRILNTSSNASEMGPGFNWDDIQGLANFNPGLAYCNGKLANVLHVKALAARLAMLGITVHAIHPGPVATNFYTTAPESSRAHMAQLEMLTSEQGADTLIWLATAPEGGTSTGGYWFQREQIPPHPSANDPEAVERLWHESERLIATTGF